ncbi:hypothetical protein MGYG_03251 [Nannizzia gypsea CBS 118893]|uniref:Uncharacterized protein n=1 Tax=Arthroderma gypseum (strain ATCC MYA-4604 / CBS 118893) TaxID=535722 RepID=E4URN8_ARTGP|nr:hypothetical protein MGYG_03251 [Nannizzia gypsea CBS 118893]EFR00248.1 hypothetical protein MGYG_03251 [Nannizzia gypsea CBS 118893]
MSGMRDAREDQLDMSVHMGISKGVLEEEERKKPSRVLGQTKEKRGRGRRGGEGAGMERRGKGGRGRRYLAQLTKEKGDEKETTDQTRPIYAVEGRKRKELQGV